MRTSSSNDGCAKIVALLLTAAITLVFGSIWRGYVLTRLWAWFIVPQFGLPALGIASAIGVCMTVGTITHQYHREPKEERETPEIIATTLAVTFIAPALTLLIGWIVEGFLH